MHITLRQIEVFNAVVRHLNYTRAAEELHLSQPAVSMQIRQLEENIGLPLFEQLGKQMFMTDAGREMHAYGRNIVDLLDEADKVFQALKGLGQGELSISVATTASHFATRLLAAFSKLHEGITISVDVTNRETLRRQLDHNERDLVIMGKPPKGMEVDADAFMENPLVMIAPSDHALAGREKIPLAHFAKESFVVRETGSGTRSAIKRFFDQHGVAFNMGIEMTSNEAIKQAVEAGLGLGIVSVHTLELELETKRLAILDVEDFPILRYWYILQRKGKRLSPVAVAFKEFVLNEASKFIRLPQ
ncbi:MAG: LysR family transcriptional regulator [Gammaproteobacteria bacterium]|nr:LysR family transcriptional regulator [Gammaproteobacteria bacterium]